MQGDGEGDDGTETGKERPVPFGELLKEQSQAERQEHRHEQVQRRVVQALEARAGMAADDGVGAKSDEAGEQQEEPVLRGLYGQKGSEADGEQGRHHVEAVEPVHGLA